MRAQDKTEQVLKDIHVLFSKAEPYEDSEFPKWALDLRRGEILFFGALPITYAMTSLVTGALKSDKHNDCQTL